MGRRRREAPQSDKRPALCQRIEWLLIHQWGNSITLMANAMHASRPALTRVIAGQLPSGRMLEALASRASINVNWLLTGEGKAVAGRTDAVPVATRLLSGPVGRHPELLSRFTLPVASPFVLEAPYWFQVTPETPIVREKSGSVVNGDYLLIETSARWTDRLEAYAGRLVVLREAEGNPVVIARVPPEPSEFEVVSQFELGTIEAIAHARLFPKHTRERARTDPPDSLLGPTDLVRYYADDVAGVALQLARFFDRT